VRSPVEGFWKLAGTRHIRELFCSPSFFKFQVIFGVPSLLERPTAAVVDIRSAMMSDHRAGPDLDSGLSCTSFLISTTTDDIPMSESPPAHPCPETGEATSFPCFPRYPYSGLTTKFDVDDLKRLCVPDPNTLDDDENRFLDSKPAPHAKDWTRGGSMGIIPSPTSHHSKTVGNAFLHTELVEMNIDKDMGGGMAAVARWTAASDGRNKAFRQKLDRWMEVCSKSRNICCRSKAICPVASCCKAHA
jgi:hypothetical protein